MIKVYRNIDQVHLEKLCQRPTMKFDDILPIVKDVFFKVKTEGDSALIELTQKFDNVKLNDIQLDENSLSDIETHISTNLKESINTAFKNIYKFHKAQSIKSEVVEIENGIKCWQKQVPIQKVGIYIPGGTAPLFSTVLMLAIPALIAGCEDIVLCSPPQKETGLIHPAILYAAKLCGVTKIYAIGGAQAIAAMTFGTNSVPGVFKIFGPGNQYVTAAKQLAFQEGIGIDMPAGPSEVLVFADDTANPRYIAADLLSQAEHGVDSQVVLITNSSRIATEVGDQLRNQLSSLPRKDLAVKSLENSFCVIYEKVDLCFRFINEYAPEHFIIASEYPEIYLDKIINAGSVFVGNYSPESAGDYASGTNHTLPTAGSAKAFSGVNLTSFYKTITFQELTKDGLASLSNTITTMARAESLEAHARAVEYRLNS